jgi:hypothetical protein
MRVMSDPLVKTEAVCLVHRGSGHLVVWREGNRIVLDAHADECCLIALTDAAVTRLFDVFGEWRG